MTHTQIAFHASFSQLTVGSSVEAEARTQEENRSAVDQLLEKNKPLSLGTRTNAIFVAGSAAHAMQYLSSEKTNSNKLTPLVYKAKAHVTGWHPMALVDYISNNINHPHVHLMTAEYWNPNPAQGWKFFESAVSNMHILEVCSSISTVEQACAFQDYTTDLNLARRLWPSSNKSQSS